MAQAKRKIKEVPQPVRGTLAAVVAGAVAPVAESQTVVVQSPAGANPERKPVMVTVAGGEKVNAAAAPIIKGGDIRAAGTVMRNLCLNLLSGTVDPALFQRDADFWKYASGPDKSAFFKLADKSQSDILNAWEKRQAESQRKVNPTLQGLAAMFKAAKGSGANPYSKLVERIREILANGQWSPEGKLAKIAELVKDDE